ncbi:hypothetical protein FAM09_22270 [Niastella caeni]|uniref:Uncharacterized protein n=1 Tax=Niastella caeni TaxID=2569763 RepID=A0A4S8HSM4_9BACT|nr:hypothetical protein [Niastella caeni]THU36112.1 hypothetical protein FAM09_22270 [Niastella caeni]
MSKLPKRHFWEWFKRYNQEYLELNKKTKKEAAYWLHELNAHLRAYFKFFGFSVTLPDNGLARLTITVNGKVMHFKKVDAFVATAPEIPGWNIIALEDPMPVDFLLEKQIEKAGIDPSELCFSFASDDPDDTDIIVYHPLCSEDNEHLFLQLAYAAVYNLLGERSFGIDFGRLEMANLSCADPDNVYQLEDLPTHIGQRRSPVIVDQNGTLLGMP